MKIETLKHNLEQTIAGKVAYLETAKSDLICGDYVGSRMAQTAFIEMLTEKHSQRCRTVYRYRCSGMDPN